MTRDARRALFLALAFEAGCSDVDLTGVYHVDARVSSSPCGADQPVSYPDTWLDFKQTDLNGAQVYAFQMCFDEAALNCGPLNLNESFDESIDGGWRGVSASTLGTGPMCTLRYYERTAVLDGDKLVIDGHNYGEPVPNGYACTVAVAKQLNKTMPCVGHERIDATRL